MKRSFGTLVVLLCLGTLSAQNYVDALRYSYAGPVGTARFAGTGGSLTPMGTDMTTLHTNPAGIGWNRYNMAQITPGLSLTGTDAILAGAENASALSETATALTLPSAGILLAGTTRSVNWSTLNFGISVTRMADFNQQVRFDGRTEGSLIESFTEQLNDGIVLDGTSALAIPFVILEGGEYFSDFQDLDGNPIAGNIGRSGLYDRSGSMSEAAIGFGGNYKEKFLWGLSIGIPFFTYEERFTYEEVDDADVIPVFEDLSYTTLQTTSGTGFNLKAGAIYLPTEAVRISASLHTPTFYSIDDRTESTLGYFYSENNEALGGTERSPINEFTYNLSTPWRFGLGAGYLIGRSGFLSVDADYTNYTGNSLSFDDFGTIAEAENETIDAFLASSIGVRVGGELNLKPFQVRAGVGYRQVPFSEFFRDEDEAQLTYSGGLGYSVGKIFIDLAAQYQAYSAFQDVYTSRDFGGQTTLTDRSRISALLTVGIRGWNAGF